MSCIKLVLVTTSSSFSLALLPMHSNKLHVNWKWRKYLAQTSDLVWVLNGSYCMDMKFSVMFIVLLCTSCLAFETSRSAVHSTSQRKLGGSFAIVCRSVLTEVLIYNGWPYYYTYLSCSWLYSEGGTALTVVPKVVTNAISQITTKNIYIFYSTMHFDGTPSSMSNPLYSCLRRSKSPLTFRVAVTERLHSIAEILYRMVGTFYLLNITTVFSDFKLNSMMIELSPSPINHRYLMPCILQDSLNPATIMSDSIVQDDPCQFLNWVAAPKITPTPDLALYECLCVLLLQPLPLW